MCLAQLRMRAEGGRHHDEQAVEEGSLDVASAAPPPSSTNSDPVENVTSVTMNPTIVATFSD
ncbi:hypothetical protein AB0B25_21815 [Nocardia sp. NPDC049190]|uniref:hypothetical protein n=1 Tax=Nocardia sp. NPDC049190 TaxID=3155650 RepID=UPI003406A527